MSDGLRFTVYLVVAVAILFGLIALLWRHRQLLVVDRPDVGMYVLIASMIVSFIAATGVMQLFGLLGVL